MTLLKSIIHPDHQERVDRIWNGIAENVIDPFYEYKIIDGSGETRWILQSNAPIYDDEGRVIAIDGCCSDITQQKNSEMEKLALEEQLRHSQKAEAIGRLTGGIAHDFNNILGIIIGNLDLAIQEIDKKERVRKKLDAIHVAAQRAREVVSQLLNFTRKKDQKREVVDVNDIVNASVQLLRSSFPSHIDIDWHIEKKLPPIAGDATQIHQVLINICTNAMHAMEEKGGTLTIDVRRYRFTDDNITAIHFDKSPPPSKPFDSTGDSLNRIENHTLRDADTEFVALKITDTGVGIDSDILEVIFDPYFTTKPMDKGNGLGLSIGIGTRHSIGFARHSMQRIQEFHHDPR